MGTMTDEQAQALAERILQALLDADNAARARYHIGLSLDERVAIVAEILKSAY